MSHHQVPFQVKAVDEDYAAAMEMIRRSGQQGVPVITTEDEVIVGFDQVRLAKIVEKYGPPKRAPLGLLAADAEGYLSRHPEAAEGLPEGTKGVFVGEVRPGSVAEQAGLKHGDIIQAVANKRVRRMSDLDALIDTLRAGESVSVRFLRKGTDETTTLQF